MSGCLANGMLLAISVCIALLLGEVIVRIQYPQDLSIWTFTRDGLTIHYPRIRQFSNKFGHEIETNSAGMRDREHDPQKIPGSFRILVLGDSFMEALQVKFEDSFVALLEKQLQAGTRRSVEVINASVSGWGTDDELEYLTRVGLKLEPDLIVVAMTLHNDISDNLLEEYHSFQGGMLKQRPVSLVPWDSFAMLKVKEWLAAHSHLYQVLLRAARFSRVSAEAKHLHSHVGDLIRRTPTDEVKVGWDMTHQLFEKILDAGRTIHAEVVVVLLPLSLQVYTEDLSDFLTSNDLRREDIELLKPQEMMKDFGKRVGLPTIDLLPMFRDTKAKCKCSMFLKDDGHWNEAGHKVAADVVSTAILSSTWIPSQ